MLRLTRRRGSSKQLARQLSEQVGEIPDALVLVAGGPRRDELSVHHHVANVAPRDAPLGGDDALLLQVLQAVLDLHVASGLTFEEADESLDGAGESHAEDPSRTLRRFGDLVVVARKRVSLEVRMSMVRWVQFPPTPCRWDPVPTAPDGVPRPTEPSLACVDAWRPEPPLGPAGSA